MSTPIKHHFVPEFYLYNWANDEKLVPVWFYSPNGQLQNAQRSPGTICYHPRLYELKLAFKDGSGFDTDLETEFYTPQDTASSKAIARSIDAGRVSNSDRDIIARFVGGLLFRSKQRIDTLQDFLRPPVESEIGALGPEARELVASKLTDTLTDDILKYVSISIGPEISEKMPDHLVKKTWQILEVDGLLTSDNPVVVEHGPNSSFGLSLPLSPKHLLIVHDNQVLSAHEYNKRDTRNFANLAILKQAHTRVVGRSERSFIQKHWKP